MNNNTYPSRLVFIVYNTLQHTSTMERHHIAVRTWITVGREEIVLIWQCLNISIVPSFQQLTHLRSTCVRMDAWGLKSGFTIKNPPSDSAFLWPDLKYVLLSNKQRKELHLHTTPPHIRIRWGTFWISPAVSDVLTARSPLLVGPAVRTDSPPVLSLSGVDLKQETGAVHPHWGQVQENDNQ